MDAPRESVANQLQPEMLHEVQGLIAETLANGSIHILPTAPDVLDGQVAMRHENPGILKMVRSSGSLATEAQITGIRWTRNSFGRAA